MIIWINGAFGSGKTTVSNILNKSIKNSAIYDPEAIGDTISNLVPKNMRLEDFQDYPEWRRWNKELLKSISSNYGGILIVPMTLYKKAYYDDIIGSLIKEGIEIRHFLLKVSKEEILNRLESRNDGTLGWGKSKVDEILIGFDTIDFTDVIPNPDGMVNIVAKNILRKIKI